MIDTDSDHDPAVRPDVQLEVHRATESVTIARIRRDDLRYPRHRVTHICFKRAAWVTVPLVDVHFFQAINYF
jgi:hypothetical protein